MLDRASLLTAPHAGAPRHEPHRPSLPRALGLGAPGGVDRRPDLHAAGAPHAAAALRRGVLPSSAGGAGDREAPGCIDALAHGDTPLGANML